MRVRLSSVQSLRNPLVLGFLGAALLLLTGFRFGALPFVPGARFSDAAVSHWPAAHFLRESIQRGELPFWRETIMGGQPFMANPLNKTAYPPQWLAMLLPADLHLNLMILLHFAIAGWGMWRWSRAHGLSAWAAAFSAFAYAFAPRAIGHTGAGHLDLLYALAWFPWVMAAVEQVFSPHPNPSPRRWGDAIALALFATLLFLADTRLSLFALATAGSYTLYLLVRQSGGLRRLTRLLPVVPLFGLLTASVIVPLLLWRPYLSRAALTQAEAGVFSLEPGHLIGLFIPAGGNVETLTYLGLPVLALAGLALIAMPRKLWGWAALTGIAALYALGVNGFLWPLLTNLVPGLLWFRVPSRAWFVVALVVPLLAGYGLDYLLNTRAKKRWLRLVGLIGLAAAVSCGAFALTIPSLPRAAALTTLIIGGGTGLILLLAGRLKPAQLAAAFGLLLFVDMALVGRTWIEWRTDYLPGRALAERLVELRARRIYSPTYSLEQQTAELYGLRLFGGVDPFQLAGMNEAIRAAGGVPDVGYSVVQPPLVGVIGDDLSTANRESRPDPVRLAAWDVSHVVAAYPLDVDGLRLVDTIEGVYVYAVDLIPPRTTYQSVYDWIYPITGMADDQLETLKVLPWYVTIVSGVSFVICLILLAILNARRSKA